MRIPLALVRHGPRLGLAGALLFGAVVTVSGGTKEAAALAGLGGACLFAVLAPAVIAFATRVHRSPKTRDLREILVRLTALLLAILACVIGLDAYDRSSDLSLAPMILNIGLGWLLAAEVGARLLGNRQGGNTRSGTIQASICTVMGLFLMYVGATPTGGAAAAAPPLELIEDSEAVAGDRVALIGLDGADWELLDLASRHGHTPHLDRIRSEGVWGPLRADRAFSPPSWTTIATGLHVSDHGVDDFVQRAYPDGTRMPLAPTGWSFLGARLLERGETSAALLDNSVARACAAPGRWLARRVLHPLLTIVAPRTAEAYDLVPTDAIGVRSPRLWEIVARSGRRATVVRWLFTLPARGSSATVISGWAEGWRTPVGGNDEELLALARSIAGGRPLAASSHGDKLDHYLDSAESEVAVGCGLASEILNRDRELDFYSHVFYFPDGLGHRLAEAVGAVASNESHSKSPSVERLLSLVEDVDAMIGDLSARGYSPIIVSDHGMEPLPAGIVAPVVSQVFELDWARLLFDLGLFDDKGPWLRLDSPKEPELVLRADSPEGALSIARRSLADLVLSDGRRLFSRCIADHAASRLQLGGLVEISLDELRNLDVVGGSSASNPLSDYVADRGIRGIHGRSLPALRRELGRYGVFAALAPDLRVGRVDGVSTLDIAPIALHLMGLPLEPGHRSDGLEIVISADCLQRDPVRRRALPSASPDLAAGLDGDRHRTALEAIRALGYLN
ncbi:MAG: hypothetical protein CME06_06050 [Gemmatimonadetes bacterium]|nr:hypothetical protein [Gemmatimonadota bacterium]